MIHPERVCCMDNGENWTWAEVAQLLYQVPSSYPPAAQTLC